MKRLWTFITALFFLHRILNIEKNKPWEVKLSLEEFNNEGRIAGKYL